MPEGTITTALLGPTNTGKTHHAIEAMLAHPSGMIGLPLRLLAREVYDKITARVGEARVALVTGEEKRVPRRPDYWVCTVEAMPIEREVDCLCVDEVQLAAHPQRGHVFTDRILRARGRRETWFLGSESIRPALEELVPAVRFEQKPRLSKLSFSGSAKLHRLPPRSAAVAFSTPHVYELAERLKRAFGGVAVVLGALSPRTRNAQVAMFQAGEVDYLVATDAIGMGLNLSLEHVAFTSLRKFDGREARELELSELGQIAGRAGRYKVDGTFGSVAPVEIPPHVAEDIEAHRAHPLRKLQWRSASLDFSSAEALLRSLETPARGRWLRATAPQEDLLALRWLVARPGVRARAVGEEAVALLWQVCTVPDFRKLLPEAHFILLEELYLQLRERGALDEQWVEQRVRELDDVRTDVDGLLSRMGAVRTWTYVAHRPGWLPRAEHWQERTRQIEDRLSDALHAALVARFVEKGATTRRRRPAAGAAPNASPSARGAEREGAMVAGAREAPTHHVAALPARGHPFAALRTLRESLAARERDARDEALRDAPSAWAPARLLAAVADASHEEFSLEASGSIAFRGVALATLARGTRISLPDVRPLEGPLTVVGAGARAQAQRRLLAFVRDEVEGALSNLRDAAREGSHDAALASVPARQALYVLEQRLGSALASDAPELIASLSRESVLALRACGVFVDGPSWYLASAHTRAALALRRTLCALWYGRDALPAGLDDEARSVRAERRVTREVYTALGWVLLAGRAVRADVVRSTWRRLEARRGTPPPAARVATWLGCAVDEVGPVWRALSAMPAVLAVDPAVEGEG